MKCNNVYCFFFVLFILSHFSCDKKGGENLTDMNRFKSQLVNVLESDYTGIIGDAAGEISCRFDDMIFQMTVGPASEEMLCQEPESEPEYVDCSMASRAYIDIPGELIVEGEEPVPLLFTVLATYSENNTAEDHITLELRCHNVVFGGETGGFSEFSDIYIFGDKLKQFEISFKQSDDNGNVIWEVCNFSIK